MAGELIFLALMLGGCVWFGYRWGYDKAVRERSHVLKLGNNVWAAIGKAEVTAKMFGPYVDFDVRTSWRVGERGLFRVSVSPISEAEAEHIKARS